jgi:hypothetical protein
MDEWHGRHIERIEAACGQILDILIFKMDSIACPLYAAHMLDANKGLSCDLAPLCTTTITT